MKKYFIIIMFLSLVYPLSAQIKLETGLIIGGGKGSISHKLHPEIIGFTKKNMDYKADFALGYRFRLKPVNSSFFYDLDVNAGIKLWGNDEYKRDANAPGEWLHDPYSDSDCTHIYASFAGTANYRIYKGLSAGVGIEPRYYFYQSGIKMDSPAIDVPVLAKLSYNFRFIELGLTYKFGVFNTLKNSYMDSLKFNDWQLSIFIPF